MQGVQALAGCRELRHLDLSHNGIADLEGVESLPLLQILLLSGTSLRLQDPQITPMPMERLNCHWGLGQLACLSTPAGIASQDLITHLGDFDNDEFQSA